MRIRNLIATLAAGAALLAATGCGEKCATETPDVQGVGTCSSGLAAGQPVTVQMRICPTCNQTLPTCDVDIQGNVIQLDPLVEACSDSNSCSTSCLVDSISCRFTAPATPGTYTLQVFDPTSGVISVNVNVVAGGGNSCALASGI
jgi:hypothetical protein